MGSRKQPPTTADLRQVVTDLSALQEAGYDTSDAGRGNKAMTERDIAKETRTSSRQAARAAHVAREDMEREGWLSRRATPDR